MNCHVYSWNAKEAKKDGKKLTLIDIIILLRSNLTHSEFRFSSRYLGVSVSSTGADKANGVRFKFIDYDKYPKRWKFVEIPLTDEQEDKIFAEACRMADVVEDRIIYRSAFAGFRLHYKIHPDKILQGKNHAKYDYAGLLSHALKRSDHLWLNALRGIVWGWTLAIQPDAKKCWCSEFVAYLIWQVYKLDNKPDQYDPSELHAELANRFSTTAGCVMNHPRGWTLIKE